MSRRIDIFEAHLFEPPLAAHFSHRLQTEVNHTHLVAARHEHRPLDDVIQLAHVPRPGVPAQRFERGGLEAQKVFAVAVRVDPQEVLAQFGDVLAPLAQGRQANLDRVEAEQKVLTEAAGRLRPSRRRCGRTRARRRARLRKPRARTSPVPDAQKLRLEVRGTVRIRRGRACPVGQLERPTRRLRVGAPSPYVPNDCLEAPRKRPGFDRDHRLSVSWTQGRGACAR